MEDLRKRCDFNNTTTRVQACEKIVDLVRNHANKDQSITSKTVQTAELKLLWEKCADENTTVSRTCCHGVLSLVENGLLDFDFAVQSLLNLVPTAKNVSGICGALCDLLVLHLLTIVDQTGQYTCPYGIRNPPHPLVTMVTARPDTWSIVLQNVGRMFAMEDERMSTHVFTMLSPLIHFTLLEPAQSPQFLPLRLTLVPTILQAVTGRSKAVRERTHWDIVRVLARSQIKTVQNISEVLQNLTPVIHSFLVVKETGSDVHKQTTRALVAMATDLCRVMLDFGMDPNQTLTLLLSIARNFPESIDSDESFLHLLTLLEKMNILDLKPALTLVYLWVKRHQGRNYALSCMAILPILQLISLPLGGKEAMSIQQSLAISILRLLQDDSTKEPDTKPEKIMSLPHFTTDAIFSEAYSRLTGMMSNTRDLSDWLDKIQSTLSRLSEVPYHVVCLVAAMFIPCEGIGIIQKALQVLAKITTADESKSPSMLPLLLYKANKVKDPEAKLLILHAIPKMVTNKVAIAPVLRTIQVLSAQPKMKAVAIAMMTSLWKQQDRCFPYLQQMIVDTGHTSTAGLGFDEVVLAKASAIRDVCKLKPHQHGSDLLAPLSDILNRNHGNKDATAVSLALQGLFYLCEAEVLDIQTAWSVLSDKMGQEQRPLVIASVCQLLSLVPELQTDDKEYQDFMEEVLVLLWQYTQSQDATVAGAAFRALSKFDRDLFKIGHLPTELTESIRQAASVTEADDIKIMEVPGLCYVQLLKLLPAAVIQDYEVFLTALVREEVAKIPRGVHHAANRKKTATNQNKSVAAIPSFLQTELERNKVPGLRPSLAYGVLQTFDPQVSTGRDGKPRAHQVVQLGRTYHQMLYTLVHECPVQLGDWHQILTLPSAWLGFLDRCYLACSQGRRVELLQQLERGQAKDPEENRAQQDMAFLWTRDKITDLICSTSSGSPTVQANGLLALGGLVVTVTKFYNSLDDESREKADNVPEFLSYSHWLNVVMETLLGVLDNKFIMSGKILNVCGLRHAPDRPPCPVLAQGGAALALSMIVPMATTANSDAVYQLLSSLMQKLSTSGGESQPVQEFFMPLALGMVLAKLFEEHFAETGGSQAMTAVWKALEALENVTFNETNNRLGGYLGLSVCLVAMCTDSRADTREHVSAVHDKLVTALESLPVTDTAFEGVCVCLAAVSGASYTSNVLTQETVDRDVAKLYQIHCEHPEMPGAALSLGMVCQLLVESNHPTVGDLILKLYGSWINGLQQQDLPMLHRLSFLKGVMALCGSEKITFNTSEDSGGNKCGANIGEVAKVTQQTVRDKHDLGLQSACAWQLGQLCMAVTSTGQSRSSVPMNYHYLSEGSTVRAMVDMLLEAGKQGDVTSPEAHLTPVLRTLARAPTQPLPPLNWAGLLSPIIRAGYGESVEHWGLELALTQSTTSSSAGLLLTSWLLPPHWDTLTFKSQLALLRNLPKLVRSVPLTKLREFLEGSFLQTYMLTAEDVDRSKLEQQRVAALEGLLSALKLPDLPHILSSLLHQTVESVQENMPVDVNMPLCSLLAQCLAELPDDLIDKATSDDFAVLERYPRSLQIRARLVSGGKQPLTWINAAVDAYMCKTESNPEECLWYIVHCCYGVHCSDAESCRKGKCINWALELMGHVRNIATEVVPVTGLETAEVLEFLLLVLSAAVSSWSSCASTQLALAPVKLSMDTQLPLVCCDNTRASIKPLLRASLPHGLDVLVQRDPWKQSTAKVINWLLVLLRAPIIQQMPTLNTWLKDCLFGLRHTAEFKKVPVWSEAFNVQ